MVSALAEARCSVHLPDVACASESRALMTMLPGGGQLQQQLLLLLVAMALRVRATAGPQQHQLLAI